MTVAFAQAAVLLGREPQCPPAVVRHRSNVGGGRIQPSEGIGKLLIDKHSTQMAIGIFPIGNSVNDNPAHGIFDRVEHSKPSYPDAPLVLSIPEFSDAGRARIVNQAVDGLLNPGECSLIEPQDIFLSPA